MNTDAILLSASYSGFTSAFLSGQLL